MARFTLTARLEGKWRWATIDARGKPSAIDQATEIIAEKVMPLDEPDAYEEVVLDEALVWERGGVTLANGDGSIIWTRPAKVL